MANDKAKNVVVGVLCVTAITTFGMWQFGVFEASGHESQATPELTVPNGYSHVQSQQTDSEIVHTYKKQPPKEVLPTQTDEVAYQRYLESLPTQLDVAMGQDFRTLSVSLQNAQLFADTTGLIRQGKENLQSLSDIENKEETANKVQALNNMNTGLVVEVGSETNERMPVHEESNFSSIRLEGVVGGSGTNYAILVDDGGQRFDVEEGQQFDGHYSLKKITEKAVIISNGKTDRSLPRM